MNHAVRKYKRTKMGVGQKGNKAWGIAKQFLDVVTHAAVIVRVKTISQA